jgi:3-hydroxyisobutyrate dehydrogenase-like beta-hydroxyacid dehydrogenase
VAAAGFRGLYVDGNAIAPATTRSVGAIVQAAGARFADGGIIGPPVRQAGSTRLYLSGQHAAEAAALFAGSLLDARAMDGPPDAASSLKMCYAAWTKGTTALLAGIRSLAASLEVEAALVEEWDLSQQGLEQRSRASVCGNAFKAWRWIAEMHEIAATFRDAGLPPGFHEAAAEVYQRLEGFKDDRDPPLAAVTRAMLS